MKLALFAADDGQARPAVITDDALVDVSALVPPGRTPQRTMETLIDGFDGLRPALEQAAAEGARRPLEQVRLLAPLPRPSKVMCCIANYWEHAQREPRPLNMFLKNPDAVVGPGDVIRLPDYTVPWMFMHEAELGVVLKGPSRHVKRADWRSAVFGYTGMMDITGRGEGRSTWGRGTWLGKSFDTFLPLGPCITTADEIEDPNDLWVQFWNDGQLRHNYNTDDMEHRVPELVEFASRTLTLRSGDLICCGTNHEGLGPVQDGETVELLIHGIGRLALTVTDPLKRIWERGIYMGQDSVNHEAVRRNRPHDAHLLRDAT
ncbi:MAG TPA: fumarylacetoacetate hydrolase family protein [Chloroflexota bacterium]|jgi:2-keto-4-pentenoate hydratase/2-oxohepta-3-ene-1,7-dioic acid hydratase in catechol pathway|nr:fumarylacetoacetate hydrolase family protein [Chloroflexota bacterium]